MKHHGVRQGIIFLCDIFYLLTALFFIIYTYRILDMPTKTRIIIVSILILLGGALFYYCAVFHPIEITTQMKGGSTTVTASEPTPVKETSIGGVERDKSGQTKQSHSEGKPRPKAGAT